jgi:hypothetical protein
MAAKQLREAHGSQATTEFPTRHLSRKQHWAPKLDRVPFPHSLPGRKVLVLSIAEGLALGLWGRLMLRREFIILGRGLAVLPRAARAQLAIPVIGFLGSALQSVSNYLAAFRNRIRTIPKSFGGNAMHATLDCLTAMAACALFAASAFSQSPEASFFTKPSAIADELWHLNGPGRSAWSF